MGFLRFLNRRRRVGEASTTHNFVRPFGRYHAYFAQKSYNSDATVSKMGQSKL